MAAVADYLTTLFEKGRCYRTINNHRSAISAYHKPVDGQKIGQHELVCQVLKACFNASPPQPKYAMMWDVDKVLNHIGALGCDSNLSDKQLTFKVAMLLALASAGRSSELRALDLKYMTTTDNTIVFELSLLTKSQRKGQKPIKLTFNTFLCVCVRYLVDIQYIAMCSVRYHFLCRSYKRMALCVGSDSVIVELC